MDYRTQIKGATSYKEGEGWYFDGRAEVIYEGPDKAAAIAAYNNVDVAAKAAEYGTAVSREVIEVDEDGNEETATHGADPHSPDLYDIHDGAEGWWMILSERHRQVQDQRLYRIDWYKGPYYVAAYQADSGFARQVLTVEANEEDMRAEVERRGIEPYLTTEELKSIGIDMACANA